MKRALWETLVKLAGAIMPSEGPEAEVICVTSVDMDLPVEVAFSRSTEGSCSWRTCPAGGSRRFSTNPRGG